MQETCVRSLDWEDSCGEGNGNPLQYSGLENSMDCTVQGVAKSRTRLTYFHNDWLWGLRQVTHPLWSPVSLSIWTGLSRGFSDHVLQKLRFLRDTVVGRRTRLNGECPRPSNFDGILMCHSFQSSLKTLPSCS